MNTYPKIYQTTLAAAIGLAVTYPSHAVVYTYDTRNRLTSVTYDSGKTFNYSYDAAGNLLRITTVIPKYTIEGYVTDKKGSPLGGVLIDVGGHTTVTDDNGYYQLADLLAGNYTLIATHDKYEFNPLDLTIGKNQPSVIDIVSDSLAKYTIEGHVTDKNGLPLGGVLIDVGGHTFVTDDNGYYQLADLLAGNYTLIATHDKYEFNPLDLTIGKNQPSVIDIVSDSLAKYTIEGHVTDKNGLPLGGVLTDVGGHTTVTDNNGYYQLTDLVANDYTLIASLNKHNFTPREISVGSNQPNVIDLVSDGLTACLLYAVHDEKKKDTQFFTVKKVQQSFEVKLLGKLHLGQDIEALDIHPDTNQIFAAAGDDGKYSGHLYQVNAITGGLVRVGATGFGEINGLSFKPEGSLWGWAEGDGLIQIDIQTGNGTLELAYDGLIEDMTWDNQGLMLYGIGQNQLLAYNSQTGQLTELSCILPGREVEALEMLPDGRLLFGIHNDKTLSLHALDIDSCQLVGIDIPTKIDEMELNDVEGIAWPIDACSQ